jgi:hypothetical protein
LGWNDGGGHCEGGTLQDNESYFDCDRVLGCCILVDIAAGELPDNKEVVNHITHRDCIDIWDGESWQPTNTCCVNHYGATNSDCPGYGDC